MLPLNTEMNTEIWGPKMGEDGIFDESIALNYDRIHGGSSSDAVLRMAKTLKQLAFDSTALEFAIGTGRVALALETLGVQVEGIEMSKAMVAELRKKETGTAIKVAIGDMTTTRLDTLFSLVFLVYNTIDNLTTQDAQIACFENAAAHLLPGGRFVIETLVPPIQKVPFGETLLAYECSPEYWGVDAFDIVSQNYTSNHLRMENGGCKHLSIPFRYAWPCELDLMARIAGLELESRWSDWDQLPFTRSSTSHVSVWRKPGA